MAWDAKKIIAWCFNIIHDINVCKSDRMIGFLTIVLSSHGLYVTAYY